MNIVAKFFSTCPVCDDTIRAGERVEWSRGEKARHVGCAAPRAKTLSVVAPIDILMAHASNDEDTSEDEAPATEREPDASDETPGVPSKRPRPYVLRASEDDLAWSPVKLELYSQVDGENVRAGEAFAIVREGHERWPLGICSDHRRVVGHLETRERVQAACAGQLTEIEALIVGHGYHVAFTYQIRHLALGSVAGVDVYHRLHVVASHDGKTALRASLVAYVGRDAIGAVATSRGLHTASNPERWQADVDGMIETAILGQDALLDELRAAEAHVLTEDDRKWLRRRGVIVKNSARTALDALRAWHRGNTSRMTWGVWSRRLDDEGLKILRTLLAAAKARLAGEVAR